MDDKRVVAKLQKKSLVPRKESNKSVELFAHLPQIDHHYLHEALASTVFRAGTGNVLLPAVQTLGMHFADRSITGARARCLALLQCLAQVITVYVVPPEKSFARDLTARINTYVQFLIDCRPLSVSMGARARPSPARTQTRMP